MEERILKTFDESLRRCNATPGFLDRFYDRFLASSPKVSVQAGSFLMKENADDLVSELSKRGFAPVVVHETVQGKDRYRVLAGTGLDTEAAKATLKKLSEEGFRGFVVADK